MNKIKLEHIDDAPNDGYPIRILEAYLESAKFTWDDMIDDNTDSFLAQMNEQQKKRQVILEKAIEKLKST